MLLCFSSRHSLFLCYDDLETHSELTPSRLAGSSIYLLQILESIHAPHNTFSGTEHNGVQPCYSMHMFSLGESLVTWMHPNQQENKICLDKK
jgi:hypothetical protein